MIALLKKKPVGFYFLVIAEILTIISIIRYASWAPAQSTMNSLILGALIAGIAVHTILLVFDNDFLVIAITILYSIALFQLLADSVGSFVDAYQGIVMFGDPTQVGTILSISYLLAACIAASIISGFMKRVNEQ